jgi:hypothetical protein
MIVVGVLLSVIKPDWSSMVVPFAASASKDVVPVPLMTKLLNVNNVGVPNVNPPV